MRGSESTVQTNSALAPVKSASITPTEGMQKSDPKRGEVAQGNTMTEPGTPAVKAQAAPAPVKGTLFSCSFSFLFFFSGGVMEILMYLVLFTKRELENGNLYTGHLLLEELGTDQPLILYT